MFLVEFSVIVGKLNFYLGFYLGIDLCLPTWLRGAGILF